MARAKSADKRNAILKAATRVIVTQGLSAPTATIAREAGVSNGSLFTYFETKADLFNELYLELKAGAASAILNGLPEKAELRAQMFHVWSNWMRWATAHPDQQRALAQLSVSDEITPGTRQSAHQTMAGMAELLERSRAGGPMRDTPMAFVFTIMTSLAEATMNFMIQEPANAAQHCQAGFDALWRVLG